jgi:hypothetical protein
LEIFCGVGDELDNNMVKVVEVECFPPRLEAIEVLDFVPDCNPGPD